MFRRLKNKVGLWLYIAGLFSGIGVVVYSFWYDLYGELKLYLIALFCMAIINRLRK